MSLVVSWIGIDTHGAASVYIAGDSRISWTKDDKFDFGKKVFSSNLYPEIFGYAGDVLFPSIVLSQIIEMIDSKILFTEELSRNEKNRLVVEKLAHSFSKYPEKFSSRIIQIMHISRDTIVNGYPQFSCYLFEKQKNKDWILTEISLPEHSGVLLVLGSGGIEFKQNYQRYQSSENRNTSRNVFHCFCDTLFNIKDHNCGGAPQLVGIYRKPDTSSFNFGIIHNKKRYFLGSEVPKTSYMDKVEWRNENFELCDGITLQKHSTAMKQPNVLRRN